MTLVPEEICPGKTLQNPAIASAELFKAILVRANFIPGVRHWLGWRGIKDCSYDVDGWTVRVADRQGVFGLYCDRVEVQEGVSIVHIPVSYFPHPEEELVENSSVQAAILTQREDYFSLVRMFLAEAEMRTAFLVGTIRMSISIGSNAVHLSLVSPERDLVIARDGVQIIKDGQEVEVVPPGGTDRDFPCLSVASSLFRVLASTVSFCFRQSPIRLTVRDKAAFSTSYGNDGILEKNTLPDTLSKRLWLGWGEEESLFFQRTPTDKWDNAPCTLDWWSGEDVPSEYADEPWWNATAPGANRTIDKTILGINEKPQLFVLTGFLGSGKTSFLQNFIEYQAANNRFVAVIQNEIGKKGLDGKLLGQQYAVMEMDEGCVCCSLVGNVKAAVQQIVEGFQPDCIVLETTGLANPFNLLSELDELRDDVVFDSVTTIVDGEHGEQCLEEYAVARAQAQAADVILLNKADLVSDEQKQRLETKIRSLNANAPLLFTEHGDVHPAQLYGVNLQGKGRKSESLFGLDDLRGNKVPNHTHSGDHISSVYEPLESPLLREKFDEWVTTLPETLFRMKGTVQFAGDENPSVVQYVRGRCTVGQVGPEDLKESPERFLVFIGKDVNGESVRSCIESLQGLSVFEN